MRKTDSTSLFNSKITGMKGEKDSSATTTKRLSWIPRAGAKTSTTTKLNHGRAAADPQPKKAIK